MSLINCRGTLLDLAQPRIMGILNLTPDSFSDGGLYTTPDAALLQAEKMLNEGADILDIGAASTRPGAAPVAADEELSRLADTVQAIRLRFPAAILSIDTYHAEVAEAMLQMGAHIVNDVSAGSLSPGIWQVAARYRAPYILMHMQGTPTTMQLKPAYADVVHEVYDFFVEKLRLLQAHALPDIILDPGIGFGKTYVHNVELLRALDQYTLLDRPLLLGISRKRMFSQGLDLEIAATLPAVSAIHYRALCQGVRILRVHDVAAADAVRRLYLTYGVI